uniref:Uncharacterized protein n=1 Tax=Zooxanthella nutricula TaxID=1333877 RepID=A0A7S2N9E3_9DINO
MVALPQVAILLSLVGAAGGVCVDSANKGGGPNTEGGTQGKAGTIDEKTQALDDKPGKWTVLVDGQKKTYPSYLEALDAHMNEPVVFPETKTKHQVNIVSSFGQDDDKPNHWEEWERSLVGAQSGKDANVGLSDKSPSSATTQDSKKPVLDSKKSVLSDDVESLSGKSVDFDFFHPGEKKTFNTFHQVSDVSSDDSNSDDESDN